MSTSSSTGSEADFGESEEVESGEECSEQEADDERGSAESDLEELYESFDYEEEGPSQPAATASVSATGEERSEIPATPLFMPALI